MLTNRNIKYAISVIGYLITQYYNMKIKNCIQCKIDFNTRFLNQKYCSRKCMGDARNKSIECVCLVCNKQYISRVINNNQQSMTCSRKCGYEYLKIKAGSYKTCIKCQTIFYSKGNRTAEYCSRKCFSLSRAVGEIIKCRQCDKEVYKKAHFFKKTKNSFCGTICANKFQEKDKIQKECKICNKIFLLSKSTILHRKHTVKYCSIKCRNQDSEWVRNACIQGNLIQLNQKGLNKLELKGRQILQDIGIKDFQEQVLMFNKFCVDVLIESKKLIIQWDGTYWHTKPKRVILDKSQDAYFKKCGYRVLRITDLQIKNNLNEVYENIKRAI